MSDIAPFIEKLKEGYELVMGCRLPAGRRENRAKAPCPGNTAGSATRPSQVSANSSLKARSSIFTVACGPLPGMLTSKWACGPRGWNSPQRWSSRPLWMGCASPKSPSPCIRTGALGPPICGVGETVGGICALYLLFYFAKAAK